MSEKSKYSKTKLVGKRWFVILVAILIVILIASISFVVYVNLTNSIIYQNIDDSSSSVDDNVASQSTPIIVSNIVIGSVYNNTWVSMERYFFKSVNKKSYDIDMFTTKGKTGSYKINDVTKGNDGISTYVTTTRTNNTEEYFAVKADTTSFTQMNEITLNEETTKVYQNNVKKALGIYGILNNTVNIKKVYEVSLVPGEISYIITATNGGKTGQGVYSTVVYVDKNEKCKLIKYNYIKDVTNASNFGIYTVKFVADLNNNGTCEIILQETKEFDTKYSVMELKKGKFYEVLSSTVKNK